VVLVVLVLVVVLVLELDVLVLEVLEEVELLVVAEFAAPSVVVAPIVEPGRTSATRARNSVTTGPRARRRTRRGTA
jgi:hypothetical protein